MAQLDRHGDQGLLGLAGERALVREVDVLDELLGDGAPALLELAAPEVHPQGPGHARGGDPGMGEEAVVLRRQHGLKDVLRQLVEEHRPALLDLLVIEGREERRLQRGALGRLPRHTEADDPVAPKVRFDGHAPNRGNRSV